MEIIITITLLLFSALFSGLTLGLLSLDTQSLKRRAAMNDQAAAVIYPIRRTGNQLLTTLLLGNVTVNTILSVYLGSLISGVAAVTVATMAIFLFGEIIPQAVISRHALWFGAKTAPLVKILLFIFYPIAKPIAYVLDLFLGHEIPTVYSHHELMSIISEHEDSEHSQIDEDEERILHGALQFSHRKVREVMTPADEVVMLDEHQRLDEDLYQFVSDEGYSRYPVFSGSKNNIIGILYVKDLLTEEDGIKIHETKEALESDFMKVRGGAQLDTVLAKMLKQKSHIAIVYNRNEQVLGVISLEDIIEEIIQFEIEDEDDE